MLWSGFVRVRESNSAFLFYPQRGAFIIVPKRALGAEGVQTIRRFVIDKFGRNAWIRHEPSLQRRAWTRTFWGAGNGLLLLICAVVMQHQHGTFIPSAVVSAPMGLLDMQLAVIATPFLWPVMAGFAGSQRWRAIGIGLVSLHTVTAIWFLTGSAIADWTLFRRALSAGPVSTGLCAALYFGGLVWLWVVLLRRR